MNPLSVLHHTASDSYFFFWHMEMLIILVFYFDAAILLVYMYVWEQAKGQRLLTCCSWCLVTTSQVSVPSLVCSAL